MTRIRLLRALQVVIDLTVLSLALWLAVFFRFEGAIPEQMLKRLVLQTPYLVALQYALLVVFGIPRFSWRYIGLREALHIARAIGASAAIMVAVRLTAGALFRADGYAQYTYLPIGVVGIDSALSLIGVLGVRVVRRLSTERAEMRKLRAGATREIRTLLIGAGRGGVTVAKEIASRPELGIVPVGFIDDDLAKHGSMVHGLPVLGSIRDLRRLVRERAIDQAIITIANARGELIRSIAAACQSIGLPAKIIPGLYQLVGGSLNLTMRDVAIDDLLRREEVVLDNEAIALELRGRVVCVTGAGGSIGAEICRQVCRFSPQLLVLVERSENALFEIHRDLRDSFPAVQIEPCVADICDADRVEEIFAAHKPRILFHAAAHKHVPMMEWNPNEAVKNNVFGTRSLADLAHRHEVEAFVMISTDKAINPTSVMGVTKRIAELYVQALDKQSATRFVTVRFGNVLGSNGSVVPIFKEQLARGGPLTVTHPDMKRYFMTIPEACQLVLQASAMGQGGEIFILDMGEPVRIVDLARDLIKLSGFQEGEIEIVFTGVRPGEKLYEELSTVNENAEKTRHPKILIGKTQVESLEQILHGLSRLQMCVRGRGDLRVALKHIVPEYDVDGPGSLRGQRSGNASSSIPPRAVPSLS